jgi:hypothetical protein
LCITHFDQSSYGGDQMKKLPSQSEKVAIVKTLLSTYLISHLFYIVSMARLDIVAHKKGEGVISYFLVTFLLHANCRVQI